MRTPCFALSLLLAAGCATPRKQASVFEARRRACLDLDWPHWEEATAGQLQTPKHTVPYAVARLAKAGGEDPEAVEHIAGALSNRVPDDEFVQRTHGHRRVLKTQYDGLFDPLGVLQALFMFRDAFSDEQLARIEAGARALDDWTGGGTENHRLMRWSNGYLFAQAFGGRWRPVREPDVTWEAARLMADLKAKLVEEGRFRYHNGGMAEYLSPSYLMFHIVPLLNLYDFAEDHELRAVAEAMIHLHLTHLALNVHNGYILEPHARFHSLQYTRGDLTANAAQFLAWLYFGHMERPPAAIVGKTGKYVIHPALSSFRPHPHQVDLANGTGDVHFPYTTRSACVQWPHAGARLPRTDLRSVYRHRSYAIGTGCHRHVPAGFYLQHSRFGIAWDSDDPVAYLQCGHPYWRSNKDNPGGWWLAPASPFQQMAHCENTAIVLFNIPEKDPWPTTGRSDWIPYRDDHLESLLHDAYVAWPRAIDQRAAADIPGLEGGRWHFFREGETYIAVAALTASGTPAVDRYRRAIRAKGVRNGERYQTGFVFEVGSAAEFGTFSTFQERVLRNALTVDWGQGSIPVPEVAYTNTNGRVLRLRYNNTLAADSRGVVDNLPDVWIDSDRLDDADWPYMQGPGVLLENGILTILHNGTETRIDWSGDLPRISTSAHSRSGG